MPNVTLSANAIIDTLIPYLDDIQAYRANVPRGSFIDSTGTYRDYYEKSNAAERAFNLANDLTGISISALYSTAIVARRWYNKTGWQKCLSTEDAEGLLNYMMEQYPMPNYWR